MNRSIALLFAAGTLLASCSKASHTIAGSSTHVTDWGVVELAASTPKHLSLEGNDCILTATLLDDGKLQIIIKTAEKLAQGEMPPGIPAGAPVETTMTVTASSGAEIDSFVAQKPVRFTPKFKAQ